MMKRRQFLTGCTAGLAGCLNLSFAQTPRWRRLPRQKEGVVTQGAARNLIFVLLEGGPSHIDTFDLKTGPWTPNSLGVETLGGGLMWPSGHMPKLATRTDQFTILRAMSAVEAVHTRAVYHLLTAHRQNAALVGEIPHFASMLSFKLADQRQESESLPTVMMIGQNPAKNGFLPLDHIGLQLSRNANIPNLQHFGEGEADRFQLLSDLMALKDDRNKKADHALFQDQARRMMLDPDLSSLLAPESDDETRDGAFLEQCGAAVRVLAANKGTRVFQLELGGWDHHISIYDNPDLRNLSREFDNGFAYLLDELSSLPGVAGNGTLLDETLIVAMGEFGRTVGPLNTSAGRDHLPFVAPAIIAGGGVQPGRVIGATDPTGVRIRDPGWSRNRFIGVNDLIATIYSALGIDWTERFEDTPSGRVFEMIDSTLLGPAYAVDELFV